MIRVLLVDDDALVRSGLRIMLAGAANLDVVAEAADGREVLGAVASGDTLRWFSASIACGTPPMTICASG